MITLKESILSDMEDTMSVGEADAARIIIDEFINNNYYPVKYTVLKKPNKDGKYVVNARGNVLLHRTAKSITNDIFVWGKCNMFVCNDNEYITNLIGAPSSDVRFLQLDITKLRPIVIYGISNVLTSTQPVPIKVTPIFLGAPLNDFKL